MMHRFFTRRYWSIKALNVKNLRTFGPIDLTESLLMSLESKNITKPTEIQVKAMRHILEGNNTIINSETGSGKTLCYLLPVIMQQEQSKTYFQNKLISTPKTLIFAPTTELLHQVGTVCRDLGVKGVNVAYDKSPLRVSEKTEFIITTPKYLMNYDWQGIKNVKCIVFDEADLMFVAQFKEVRKLFEFYTGRKIDFSRKESIRRVQREAKKKYVFKQADEVPQFVFAGATIPHGGRKTTLSLVERFVPDAQLIQTEMAHKVVKNTKFEFIKADENFDTNVTILAVLLERELTTSNRQLGLLNKDGGNSNDSSRYLRTIVFANKVSTAEKVYQNLIGSKKTSRTSKYSTKGSEVSESDSKLQPNMETSVSFIENKTRDENDFSLSNFQEKWHNSICFLHSGLSNAERLSIVDRFASGEYNVLVTTGIAARGLDIPNVNLVVQFDFPLNISDVIHRAGRTGRAGEDGKVISFISEKNQDLYKLFRAAIDKDDDVTRLFSRRRRLRRRIKENKAFQEIVNNEII